MHHFQVLICAHHLADLMLSRSVWQGAVKPVWLRGCETHIGGFTSAAFLSRSISNPTHLPEKKHPNYTHCIHRRARTHTHTQTLPSVLLLLYLSFLPSIFLTLTEASQREGAGFDVSSPWFWAFRSRGCLSSSSPNPQTAWDKEQTYWSAFPDPFA